MGFFRIVDRIFSGRRVPEMALQMAETELELPLPSLNPAPRPAPRPSPRPSPQPAAAEPQPRGEPSIYTSAHIPARPHRPQPIQVHLDSIDCPVDEDLIHDLDPEDAAVKRLSDPVRPRRASSAPVAPAAPRDNLEPLNINLLRVYEPSLDAAIAPPQTEQALPLRPPDTRAPQEIKVFLENRAAELERRAAKAREGGGQPSPSPSSERVLFRLAPLERPLEPRSSTLAERAGGPVHLPSLREVSMRMLSWIIQNAPQSPQGNTQETDGVWRAYMELCPDDVDAQESYGWYLLDFHGHQQAFDYFLERSQQAAHKELFFYALAQLSYKIADYAAAYYYIELVYQSLPEDPIVLKLKYEIERISNRQDEARATYAQLMRYAYPQPMGEVQSGR